MKKTVPVLFLIVLFAAAGWYFFAKQPDPVSELPPPQLPAVSSAESQATGPQPEDTTALPEPELMPEPLPLLSESDPEISRSLAEITDPYPLEEYLVKSEVISRMVATIDALTSRQVPSQINPVKLVDGKLVTDMEGESIILSEENFARYDGYIELIQDADATALVALYKRYQPLFQQAWEQNGGEGSFDDRLLEVINNLLQTPDVSGPVYLTKPEAVYLFEDPELETLTAGQKLLVRMGSANAAVVKEKLTAIKEQISQ